MNFQTIAEKSYFSKRKHVKMQSRLRSHDREQKPVEALTRQHGDTDGATLLERINRGMLGHAGVLPLIRWAHLHQCQPRRRQDPIIPLKMKDPKNQTSISRGSLHSPENKNPPTPIYFFFGDLIP